MASDLTIYKYNLPTLPGVYRSIELPPGRVLSVGTTNGTPVMWAEVNRAAKNRVVDLMIAWTGQPMPGLPTEGWRFLGTVVYDNDSLVAHVYVRGDN